MLCGISVTFPVSTRKWNNWNNVTKSSLNFFLFSSSKTNSFPLPDTQTRPIVKCDYRWNGTPTIPLWLCSSCLLLIWQKSARKRRKNFLPPPLFSFPRGACRARWKWGNWIAPVGLFSLCGRPARVRRPGQVHAPSLPFASLSSSRAREKLGLQSPLKRSDDLGLWSKTLSLKHTQRENVRKRTHYTEWCRLSSQTAPTRKLWAAGEPLMSVGDSQRKRQSSKRWKSHLVD